MRVGGRRWTSCVLGAIALSPFVVAQNPSASSEGDVHSFSIPDLLYAKTWFESARGHIAAQRFGDAISDLQRMLESYRGAVLGAERKDPSGRHSEQDFHPGAARRAFETLFELPEAGRKLYRDRYEVTAGLDLARAKATGDRRALADVAFQYPLTLAAQHAWVALGDVEVEMGDLEAGVMAWQRAADFAQRLGDALDLGAARNALVAGDRAAKLPALEPAGAAFVLDDGSKTLGPIPGPDCHAWKRRLMEDDPGLPFAQSGGTDSYNLFPVVADETVYVSTTMRLIAYNAYSGHPVWRSDEAPGWAGLPPTRRADFLQHINFPALLAAPAVWGSVAVTALQVPVAQVTNSAYNGIPITTITPDRRLFAFDADTGEPLWNHLPPLLWDGESGDFQARMRVAGPPIAWQGRVLAPFYRMQGRVEYHVGCFDLYTGHLLWSTALISGQVELNMFGRQSRELCTAPLAICGDRVIALTQLGAIAALDVFTGEIEWETLYDQIPLPRAEGFSAGERQEVWKNAPPVVADGVVVATPFDSNDLIGVDLAEGTLLWSAPYSRLRGPRVQLSLLGASPGAVVVGGAGQVVELRSRTGLAARGGPTDMLASDRQLADSFSISNDQPRPLLAGPQVIVSSSTKRWVLPRSNLRSPDARLSGNWSSDQPVGNLALGHGALYALSNRALTGLCDWARLEERLDTQWKADPKNIDLSCAYADFLQNRAELERREGRAAKAKGYLERARAVLEPLVDARSPGDKPQVSDRIHTALLGEARVLTDLADTAGALDRLQRSRAWALDVVAQRDTLLALAAATRDKDRPRYRAILAELDLAAGALDMPRESDPNAADDVVTREEPVPVGIFAERELARVSREDADLAGELAALHALIERCSDDPRFAPDKLAAAARIGEILSHGTPSEYAPFEAKAQALLLESKKNSDVDSLSRVAELFPHSKAAGVALDTGLDIAAQNGLPDQYARQFTASLGEPWSFARASEVEIRRAIRLANLFGRFGNAELVRSVLRRLARTRPDLIFDPRADPTRTLADVVATLPKEREKLSLADHATFDSSVRFLPGDPPRGSWNLVGALPLADDAPEDAPRTWIATSDGRVFAWKTSPTVKLAWPVFELDRHLSPALSTNQIVLTTKNVIVALANEIVAIDAENGSESWRITSNDEMIERTIFGSDGVVLYTTSNGSRWISLNAVSATSGTPMWSVPLGTTSPSGQQAEIVGAGRVVVLPTGGANRTARVFDLFTGKFTTDIELDSDAGTVDARTAWIEKDRLIVPAFRRGARSTDWVRAWSLDTGARSWSVPAEPDRELDSVLRVQGSSFLVLGGGLQSGRPTSGSILELDVELGAVRAVQNVKLAPGDLLIGIARLAVNQLSDPFVFVRSEVPGAKETSIRAIHLPYGERWSYRLPVPIESFYTGPMPKPAMSQSTVAVAYTRYDRSQSGKQARVTELVFLDRTNGAKRDLRTLDIRLGSSDGLELGAAGDALFLCCGGANGLLEILAR